MSVQEANAPFISYMWHAITLAQLGRVDEARTAVEEIMRIIPTVIDIDLFHGRGRSTR